MQRGDFMTFKELLETVIFDDIWKELNKEYFLNDGAFEPYLGVFNQLKKLTPEPCHDRFRLAVVRVEDGFEPGNFIYDVFGIKPDDKERYALEVLPWKKWLSFEVIDKCIEVHSAAVVVAHSLYELTFFGYDAIEVEERIKKEIEIILNERHKEFENGTAKYVPWEEVCKELGYAGNRTEKEKELEYSQLERINAENKMVYEEML